MECYPADCYIMLDGGREVKPHAGTQQTCNVERTNLQ